MCVLVYFIHIIYFGVCVIPNLICGFVTGKFVLIWLDLSEILLLYHCVLQDESC